MSTVVYESSGWGTASACSPLIGEAPFEDTNTEYIFRQWFTQKLGSFTRLALSTPHPDDSTLLLVAEGTPQDLGGMAGKWERVYARVPARRRIPDNTMYVEEFDDTERGIFRVKKNTVCEIWYDYFHVRGDQVFKIPLYSAEKKRRRNGSITTIGGLMFTSGGGAVPDSLKVEVPLFENGNQVRKIAENSELERWMGNIWCRKTTTVRVFVQSGIAIPN